MSLKSQLASLALVSLVATGCGYSEEEMRAKLREVDALRQQLSAEGAQNKKFQRDLDESRAQIEQLKSQLSDANVDVANLKSDVEEKARALEEFKRRAAQLEEIKRRFELLRAKLQDLTKLGLKVTVRHNRMVIELPGDVLFDSGKFSLRPETREKLAKISGIVLAHPGLRLDVEGHTDAIGSEEFNQKLSDNRAATVREYLIAQGINGDSVTARGLGKTQPIAPNDTNANRQKNRRVEMVVSGEIIGTKLTVTVTPVAPPQNN